MSLFDLHAAIITKRQYALPGESQPEDVFKRVSEVVASSEPKEDRGTWAERFYRLMAEKRFLPGGRILAGAGTEHGNLLNCYVQGALKHEPGTLEGIMEIARKLALVTKVGGGNGVNLDAIPPATRNLRVTFPIPLAVIQADHPDAARFVKGDYPPPNPGRPDRGVFHPRILRRAIYGEPSEELRRLANENGVSVLDVPPPDRIEVEDDMGGILDAAAEAVRRALAGKPVTVDLSQLRPEGDPVQRSGGTASGPVSFMAEIFDHFLYWAHLGGPKAGPVATLRYVYAPILRVVRQGGTRRGAGMATLSWHHPDVLDFLTAKDLDREAGEGDISTFNISILANRALMEAEPTSFRPNPVPGKYGDGPGETPIPTGDLAPWLLREIAQHAWGTGEPGLIFIDRVNEKSALRLTGEARWEIRATNPCGEIPLADGEACNLGAMVLPGYVKNGKFDFDAFQADVKTAVRFLDNVLDVTRYAVKDNAEAQAQTRRLGLGLMGLADALILLGLEYGSEEAVDFTEWLVEALRESALEASQELAEERGAFPLYERYREAFEEAGLRPRRNLALLTVAPTGTVSMVAGVSSGIEPVFAAFVWRRIGEEYVPLVHPLFEKLLQEHPPTPDYASASGDWDMEKVLEAIQGNHGSLQGLDFIPEDLRRVFLTAHDLDPAAHVEMQAAVQRAFDGGDQMVGNAISKTINLPHHASVAAVLEAYRRAWARGAKGITVYRDGSRDHQVLSTTKAEEDTPVETKEAPTMPVHERPTRLRGFTDMIKLTNGDGQAHSYLVTVNSTPEGHPIEVILTTGKAGDETNADSEALGRVVSIALQYGVPPEALAKTLRGINGGLYGNYRKRFVTSKADLIAVALEEARQAPVPAPDAEPAPAPAPAPVLSGGAEVQSAPSCPNCSAPLVREEGCWNCKSCGYSKCG